MSKTLINWSQMEQGALANFLAAPGPLKSALERFITASAQDYKAACALSMQSVPRDVERAADYAAKAQAFDEFWSLLADELKSLEIPLQGPTLEERRGVTDDY